MSVEREWKNTFIKDIYYLLKTLKLLFATATLLIKWIHSQVRLAFAEKKYISLPKNQDGQSSSMLLTYWSNF